ncbi:cation-translocating P-type ATPase [Nitrogeniibacter mangrovi]|uniref:P-type Cu(+) transporter n=1 Tax=Nitrogeniibacter mangrovi TaxID=2016596 RepID=A0A6C1AZ08_9RHOO|nr:cation-translocating P-type ATPase [Nitrogeniibacter mangrovi]QID16576.1 cation-translocating P-type ATPase [Nitrogeniibacter mangrovi]
MNTEFPTGLSAAEAARRRAREGPNELGVERRRTVTRIALEVVREPMFLLLLGAGAIYLAMGDAHEAVILLGFVVIIMGVSILQEMRTEHALEALRDLSSPRALVIRDGSPNRIAGRDVVRGDILILAEGDRVPADGVVLQAHELAADESMLTGESEAVDKHPESDRVYAGTLLVRGQGLMEVTAIGTDTELGRIGKSLERIDAQASPLHDEVGRLTQRLALIGIGVCVALALLYRALRGGWMDGLLAGITLAMGILPQEFPVIMIVFFALGARRIARQRVLTRRLNAIETLGETTVLCVDKTGTLTQNRMAVAALAVGERILEVRQLGTDALPERYHELLEYAVLASEIDPHDPMEQAFHRFAHDYLASTEHLHPDWSLAREYEMSPELLAMSHLWQGKPADPAVVASKGAPEAIADLCHLDDAGRRRMDRQAEALADRGLRVLAIAKATSGRGAHWPEIQHDFDFEFVGLVGLADPLRPEVPEAVAECRRAGIRVVMITGDHPRTACAIATAAGIDGDVVLSGAELAGLDAGERASRIASVGVFARVTPQQKLDIVEAFKARGDVVAMTGDGVNDAPALKSAHIGIAMGKRGTDVAREAASLVLLEDDFSAIVAAIRLGRRIFANLRQALVYTLAVHVPIVGLAVLPLIFGMPVILAPIHIAFLELVIDPACSVVFEAQRGRDDLMAQPPRTPAERLLPTVQLVFSLILGALTTIVCLLAYREFLVRGTALEVARALVFVVMVVANAALIFSCRSPDPLWRRAGGGLSGARAWVVGSTLVALAGVTLVPQIAAAFAFQVPSPVLWAAAFCVGIGTLALFEVAKTALNAMHRPRTG